MCDFHSIIVRVDGAIGHIASNSHSGAAEALGWKENEDFKPIRFVEVEWDGMGKYPGAEKISRGELNAKQRIEIDRHYQSLSRYLNKECPHPCDVARFSGKEYSDVRLRRAALTFGHRTQCFYLVERMAQDVGPGFVSDISGLSRKADYSMLWPKFALWMLIDKKHGVINRAKTEESQGAIENVSKLYAQWISGTKPSAQEWRSAADTAYFASADAADAAGAAAYCYAAAYDAANAAYARKSFWCAAADKFIQLAKECS